MPFAPPITQLANKEVHLAADPAVPVSPLHPCQVIFALPPVGDTDLTMRIYNSDGSEPEMCGNGIRCLARFVADVDGVEAKKYRIHTLAGDQGRTVDGTQCMAAKQQLAKDVAEQ